MSYKYYFSYKVELNQINYQFNNHNSTIDNLIYEINKDTEFDFKSFYDDKYNEKRIEYQRKVETYIHDYNIMITKNIQGLSYQLLLLLLSYHQYNLNILYGYEELKTKIQKDISIDNFHIIDVFTFYKKNESIENKTSDNKPKYLIFKSFKGFGDRLQCLLYAMRYCLLVNRILVVDWTDDIWCDNETYDFDYYFKFKDIITLTLHEFKKRYNENKNSFSVFPVFWEKDIFTKHITHINDVCLQNQNTILYDICNKDSDDFKEDIIIYTGNRYRYYSYYLFGRHLMFHDSILTTIYQTEFYKKIVSKNIEYCVIHLRGGDRMITPDDRNSILWDNNSINENEYIEKLLLQVDDSYQTILLLSDTTSLFNKCYLKLQENPHTIYMTNNTKQNTREGLHTTKNISKIQTNQEMLTDFYFMAKANKIINDNISIFSNVCKNIVMEQPI